MRRTNPLVLRDRGWVVCRQKQNSSRVGSGLMKAKTPISAMTAIGIRIKNTQRQDISSLTYPPISGAIVGATPTPILYIAVATPRFSPVNSSITTDCEIGVSGDPKLDCTTRQMTSSVSEVESPHISVETPKPIVPHNIQRRRPKRLENQPARGMVTAVAIKFAVTIHAIWSGLADNAP